MRKRRACAPGVRSNTSSFGTYPPITMDGAEINLQLNAGLLVDLPHLEDTGATGIGLFRTELQFMIAERMPTATEQQALYDAVVSRGGRPRRSRSGRSISAATRSCPTCRRSRRRTRRSAGAPSASASTVRRSCAMQIRALLQGRRRPRSQDHVPDGGDLRRVRPRQGPGRAGEGASLPARLSAAGGSEARRHAGSALAAVPARGDLRAPPISSRSAPTT